MNIKITGKDVKATEAIKEYVAKKVEKLEKYFGDELDISVTIKVEGNEQIAEMGLAVKGDYYRAVTADKDMYASIDKDLDILEGQIRKRKTKKDKQNKDDSIKQKNLDNMEPKDELVENEIVKSMYYEVKPMYPEDAKLKLQEKPSNTFLVFINLETDKVNVIYKLKDGNNYGLVEPEA